MSAWNRRFETRCSETILAFSWPIVPVSPLARSFRELITKHRSWSSKLYLVGFLTQRRSFEHSPCSQLIFTSRLLQPDVSIPAPTDFSALTSSEFPRMSISGSPGNKRPFIHSATEGWLAGGDPQSTSSTESPFLTIPSTKTAQYTPARLPCTLATVRSTCGSCSPVSGSREIILQRGSRSRTDTTALDPMRSERPTKSFSAKPRPDAESR